MRIKEHKQEDVNTQSDIANMDESNQNRGSRTRFQRTNRHSGGDQERGPWITVKGLVVTIIMNQSKFRSQKLELNKIQ